MAKKALDPKAREKRQKMIAIGGFVVLLGVLAFTGPKTWKMLHQKAPADESHAVATPSTGSSTSPLAPPTLGASSSSAQPAGSSSGLVDAQPPAPADGQLIEFGLFDSKDPFVQQIAQSCEGDATGTEAPACSESSTPTTTTTTTTTKKTGTTETATTETVTTTPVVPTSAVISVNGVAETVSAHGAFPAAAPTFKLVAIAKKSVKIGIVGGSFASGIPTVTLKLGKPLTLMNTADGTRYVLRLISVA